MPTATHAVGPGHETPEKLPVSKPKPAVGWTVQAVPFQLSATGVSMLAL